MAVASVTTPVHRTWQVMSGQICTPMDWGHPLEQVRLYRAWNVAERGPSIGQNRGAVGVTR